MWLGLCNGEREAIASTKTFFSAYVEVYSVRTVMVLGLEEYTNQRTLNSASTVLGMWRQLVKEADETVLQTKRREEYGTGAKWRLRFLDHNAKLPASSPAVFEVSRVSLGGLTRSSQLTREWTVDLARSCEESRAAQRIDL